jgi:DNA (cytosine-5)-methyltransferase 1
MKYLSVCSGIEAASVAWHHLGWEPVGFSEIEPFPAAVLKHRFSEVPNYGDMTKFQEWPIEPGTVDLLVGGTPCQSFSVAGLRKGLEDPRGNLMLTYLAIAARLRPKYLVWENVPGVLSSGGGRDFGTFLRALGQLGYGWCYRCLDAQYVRVGRWPRAVPQRRRRVFVVGCLGNWTAAAEVLALREGLQRNLEASGKARKGAAPDAEGGAPGGCWPARVASTLNHSFGDKLGLEDQHALHGAPLFVPDAVGALTAKGPTAMGAPEVDAHHYTPHGGCWWDGSDCARTLTKQNANGAQRMPDKDNFGAVLQPTAYRWQNDALGLQQDDAVAALRASAGSSGFHEMNHPVIAQPNAAHAAVAFNDTSATLKGGSGARGYPDPSDGNGHGIVGSSMTVRRLTPVECERLQGFPDNWTAIPWRKKTAEECPDGPRYKALGNSMACNCMAWIGERIAKWEAAR